MVGGGGLPPRSSVKANNFIVENLFEFSLKDKDGPMNKFKDSLIDAVARKQEVNYEPTY